MGFDTDQIIPSMVATSIVGLYGVYIRIINDILHRN